LFLYVLNKGKKLISSNIHVIEELQFCICL